MLFNNDIFFLIPECYILLSFLILLIYGTFKKKEVLNNKNPVLNSIFIVILVLCNTGFLLFNTSSIDAFLIGGSIVQNLFIYNSKLFLLFFTILVLLMNNKEFNKKELDSFEYSLLFLLSTFGLYILIQTNDFLIFYLCLELQSLSLYVLAASNRNDNTSVEAGLKYFVLGSLASGLLLFGISIIYGFTGTVNMSELNYLLFDNVLDYLYSGIILGILFIIAGIFFKLPLAPFHNWAPDVYEGAPTAITAFFAIVPKLAIISVLIRVLYCSFPIFFDEWSIILIITSVISLLIGSFGALIQSSVKRFWAYSTIGHLGWLTVSVSTGTVFGLQSTILYLLLYSMLSVGFFSIIFLFKNNENLREPTELNEFNSILESSPILAIILILNFFSLAGIPPLAGFFSKFYILISLIEVSIISLAILLVLISVISCFYYIRFIKIIFFNNKNKDSLFFVVKKNYFNKVIIIGSLFVNISFFIYADILILFCQQIVNSILI